MTTTNIVVLYYLIHQSLLVLQTKNYLFLRNFSESKNTHSLRMVHYSLLSNNLYNIFSHIQLLEANLLCIYCQNLDLHLLYLRLFILSISDFHQSVGLSLHPRLTLGLWVTTPLKFDYIKLCSALVGILLL